MNKNIMSLYKHACLTVYTSGLKSYEIRDNYTNITTYSNAEFVLYTPKNFKLKDIDTPYFDHYGPIPNNLKQLILHWSTIYNVSNIYKARVTIMKDSFIIKSVSVYTDPIGYYPMISLLTNGKLSLETSLDIIEYIIS